MTTVTGFTYVPYLATYVRVGALARAGVGIQDIRAYLAWPTFDVRLGRPAARLSTARKVIDVVRHVDELPKNLRVAHIAQTQGRRSIESIDPEVLYDPFWDGHGHWRVHGPTQFHPSELFDRQPDQDREIHHDQMMFRVQGFSEEAIRKLLGLSVREYYRAAGRPFRSLVPNPRRRVQAGIVLGWLATGGDGRPSQMRTALGSSITALVGLVESLGLVQFDGERFRLSDACAQVAHERGTIRP